MMRRKVRQVAVISAVAAIAMLSGGAFAGTSAETVKHYVQAYNDRDVEKMLASVATDIRWMSVAEDAVSVETSNRIELRAAMSAYFLSTSNTRSELRSIVESGPFVHTVEEAFWSTADGVKSQCSMAIYELAEQKIRNVWYFAAYPCP